MAKKDKKKKSQVVPYKKKGMTFKDATNWLVPKKLKKVGEGIKKVRTKISEAAKRRADAKAAAQKPMDDYIAKKGPIPTRPMAKSGKMDVGTGERAKLAGGEVKHTSKSKTQKHSPDKPTGGYKPGSVVAKTQKKTLHGGKLSSSQKKLDTLAKEKEKIRNSNMTMQQKKDAMSELNKKKESAGMEAGRKARQADVMETEEGQKAYAAKMKRNRELAAEKKKKNKKY